MESLLFGKYYHIYNHAVGSDNLFLCDDNYNFFLKKYLYYIYPIAETFAYCLMPNHFHFLIKIRELPDVLKMPDNINYIDKLSQPFSNLFNSYTKSFNKQQNRKGALFCRPFKRKMVDNDDYFKRLVHYIHYNPVHHGFNKDFKDWKHSSYESFISHKESKIERQQVFDWFVDKNGFYEFHQQEVGEKFAADYNLEFD